MKHKYLSEEGDVIRAFAADQYEDIYELGRALLLSAAVLADLLSESRDELTAISGFLESVEFFAEGGPKVGREN